MKFLIVSDPSDRLKPKTDTGLALLRAALARGHEVSWARASDVGLVEGTLLVSARAARSCAEGALPVLAPAGAPVEVSSFDGAWIRKDPPFDSSYVSLCWLLELEEPRVRFINRPSILLRFHEKMIPFHAMAAGLVRRELLVPTLVTASFTDGAAVARVAGKGSVVTKPWLGYGGNDVRVHASAGEAFSALGAAAEEEREMVQPLLDDVRSKGDRRVFFLDGRMRGDFVRLPPAGSWISNLAQGGRGESRPLSAGEREICEGLGAFLKKEGILFAGADLLAGRLSEVNITAPTGVATLKGLGGPDLAEEFVRFAEEET